MRDISRFRHLMPSHVTVRPRTGTTIGGTPSYGAAASYRAHLSRKPRLVRTRAGEEVVSSQAIYLDSADAIEVTAQVTLSTADVGSTQAHEINPTIVAVDRRFDQRGPHHTILFME